MTSNASRIWADLFGSDPNGVLVFNGRGQELYQNPAASAWLDALRLSAGQLAGDSWTGSERKADGQGRWARISESVLPPGAIDDATRLIRIEDVTADVRSRELEDRLLHAERLAAMGQLAAGVAHEVNNPAAFVTANLCLVQELLETSLWGLEEAPDQTELRSRLQECVEVTRENLQGLGRISAIVKDLRRFSRIERDTVEWVHVNEAVNAACNLVYNQIRHRAQLVKELDRVPSIPADRHKLTQVLMNLLMNAAQAIPEYATGKFIRVRTERRADEIEISVIDSGRGIPPEMKDQIFDPFFTTKGHEQGTGLGLALCADIVRQHGGRIEVDSEVGVGSCFRVILPVETGLVPRERIAERKEPVAPVRKGRILVVDDEPLLLKAFRRSLARSHEVVTVDSGRAALDLLRRDAAFDAVVCDLMMPEIDGIEVHRWARRHAPALSRRFIFCSGGAFTHRAGAFCDNVDLPVLEKPVSTRDLEHAIQRSLTETIPIPMQPEQDTMDLGGS
jgi:signal transduction histidine kinase/ActR/RegA family two-component response regulator